MGKQSKTLLFIDTNVLLDFYRVRGRQGELSILNHIDDHHERVITTAQVEMEFKKNRARVIVEGLNELKNLSPTSLDLPSYLADSKQAAGLTTNRKKMNQQLATLRARLMSVLEIPTRHDPVYRVAQRLFRSSVQTNLRVQSEEFDSIHELARKRWMLGYPPRKEGDTSMGDAVNWEWIIECAKRTSCDIVIVSRDRDYGETLEKRGVVNDWLRQEFQERVSRRRKLLFTDRLAEGMKLASIAVSKAEQKSEEAFLLTRERLARQTTLWDLGSVHLIPEETLARLSGGLMPRKFREEIRQLSEQFTSSVVTPELLEALERFRLGRPTQDTEGESDA